MMKINFDENKQRDPRREGAMKVTYAPAKRKVALFRWYLILLIVGSPLLYFFGKMLYLLLVVNAPGYVSLNKTPLNASTAGVVGKIVVKPGDVVHPGDPLVLLNDPRLDERESILRAELQTLHSSLPPTGSNKKTLLRDRIDLAKNMVDYQEKRLQQVRYLFGQGAATQAEIDVVYARYTQARYAYNQEESRFTEWLDNAKREASAPSVHADLRTTQIRTNLDAIEKQRKKLIHVATVDARILDVFVREGVVVSPGSNLLLLGDLKHTVITCYLNPKYVRYSKAGEKATLKFPDNRKYIATVKNDANLTKRLPGDLVSPIGSRDLKVIVQLVPDQPLPDMFMIDGLPVSVRFHGIGFPFVQD
jgi:multidrug resistance efflux pump